MTGITWANGLPVSVYTIEKLPCPVCGTLLRFDGCNECEEGFEPAWCEVCDEPVAYSEAKPESVWLS